MRTVKIIHSSPREEAEMAWAIFQFIIALAIFGVILRFVNSFFEERIAMDQLAIEAHISSDAITPEAGVDDGRYTLAIRMQNRSDFYFTRIGYRALLLDCPSASAPRAACTVIDSDVGEVNADLPPGLTGRTEESLDFDKASRFAGTHRVELQWLDPVGQSHGPEVMLHDLETAPGPASGNRAIPLVSGPIPRPENALTRN